MSAKKLKRLPRPRERQFATGEWLASVGNYHYLARWKLGRGITEAELLRGYALGGGREAKS